MKRIPKIETRGPKFGQCNICGDVGSLTEDHSPPKVCVRPTAVQVRHIIELLADEKIPRASRISQNGVKYRTLCHRCNNSLLGASFDPELGELTTQVSRLLSTRLQLPSVVNVSVATQKLARAVLGHMAAQGVDRYLKGPDTEAFRDFFLDRSRAMPPSINLYYWAFPHMGRVAYRDAAYLDIPTGRVSVIWVLKFFPLGFMATWDEKGDPMFNLPSLSQWRDLPFEDRIELPIPLIELPHPHFPEAPTDRSILTVGREAHFAVPHIVAKHHGPKGVR